MDEDQLAQVLERLPGMLCLLGSQQGAEYVVHIAIFSKEELLDANQAAITNGYEAHTDQHYLTDTLIDGNSHPIVTALQSANQLVTCKVLVSETAAVWVTVDRETFEELDSIELSATTH